MSSIVYVTSKSGRKYAYSNKSYRDKETHEVKHLRKCIGHVDPESGKIVPNHKKQTPKPPETGTCEVLDIGVPMLAQAAAERTGLLPILKKTFPEDWDAMLTCAYYLVGENQALCHVGEWSAAAKTPYGGKLASQRVSELLTRITPAKQRDFFAKWIGMNHGTEDFFALDITSVSSYSKLDDFVRHGYNRDKEKLPQINMLMITGEKSHLPVYFQMLPGSIPDIRTLRENLDELYLFDAKSLNLVMDKGFCSEPNITALYKKHYHFVVGVPFSMELSKAAVERNRDTIKSHEHYIEVRGNELYAVTDCMLWQGEHRCYVHTYYDNVKAAIDERKFDHELLVLHEELASGHERQCNQTKYKKFFIVKDTPRRGRKVSYNEEAISAYKKNHVGWFVLISNHIKDAAKALEAYRSKDAVEKEFDDLKNDLDMKRLRMHRPNAVEGRLFIQFLASILTAWLKNIMNEHGWFRKHSLQDVVCEMKTMREVRITGKRKRYISTLTAFQQDIVSLYQLLA